MGADEFQIRLCFSCGLRYPVENGEAAGFRCPVCQEDTQLIAKHRLQTETWVPFKDPALHLETLLDNVRSAGSVGAIVRTAYGFGLKHLYLCGLTPTPEFKEVRKTSLGAEANIPWTYHKDSFMILQALKEQGYKLFALEQDMRAVSIKEIALARRRRKSDSEDGRVALNPALKPAASRRISSTDRIALILGNEVTGVDPELLNLCDDIVYIPMQGDQRSFQMSMAFAVAVSQLTI